MDERRQVAISILACASHRDPLRRISRWSSILPGPLHSAEHLRSPEGPLAVNGSSHDTCSILNTALPCLLCDNEQPRAQMLEAHFLNPGPGAGQVTLATIDLTGPQLLHL